MRLYFILLSILQNEVTAASSHLIIQYTPRSEKDFKTIRNIEKVFEFEPDFIILTRSLGKPGSILLHHGTFVDEVAQYFDQNGLENHVFEYEPPAKKTNKNFNDENISSLVANYYLSYDQQMRYVSQLQETDENLVKVENIGNTVEGRNITAVKFGFPGNKKPIFWVNAGIHAREWIGHSTAIYLMSQLTTNPEWLEILKKIDIIVSPNANPDGYEYSRTTDRLWRTNRNVIKSGNLTCYGIDINRNFPFKWKPFEAKPNEICGAKKRLVYSGKGQASEKETQALTGAMERLKDKIKGFVDLHSVGEQILYPWGYSISSHTEDVNEVIEVANKMKHAIQQERENNYTVLNMAELKIIHGSSLDYAKSIGIKYAYLLEMSGTTDPKTRWITPESMIEPVAREIINALKVLAEQIVTEFTV